MSQISFDQIQGKMDNNSASSKVGFFSLKNDGDEAVVRIMHDTTDSFELLTVHPITLDGKYRKVNCIRDPREPMDKCPLCSNGEKVQQRFFVHMIQYDRDENGNVIAKPVVWERSASYAVTVKNLIDEYGPLSDCIFKIRRSGAAKSMNTTYSILFCNPAVYKSDMYPKNDSAFNGYTVLGNVVMNKDFDELSSFVVTGAFPQKATPTEVNQSPQIPSPSESYRNPISDSSSYNITGIQRPNRVY